MLHMLRACSKPNSSESTRIDGDGRVPIAPKWSTTRKPINVELKMSNRHKIAPNRCIQQLLDNFHRARLQLTRNSTIDPYIKITLNPSGAQFQTLPIYGGDYHVGFTQFDENEARFKISSEQLLDMNCTLYIQAFDSDLSSNDNFIGEIEIFLNTETGLIKDIHLFTTIPIKSISSENSNKFAGKIEIAVLWTEECLEVSVLNATHLRTQESVYKRIEQDIWLIIRCSSIFILFFVFGAAIFSWTESWKLSTSLWFLIVTTTTVGYGDVVPHSDSGKLFNCLYLMLSTILLGWAFSIMMNYIVSINADKYKSIKNAKMIDTQKKLKTFKHSLFMNFWIMMAFLIIAVLFYTLISKENWSWIDSLQFAVVTMSTVGYGDVAPKSAGGRIFAVFFMVFGIILLGRFASNIMEYMLAKRHESMIAKIMDNTLITEEQIAEFDVDGSGNISKYEYLSKMLILTNEVETSVIAKIMNRFNEIDKDGDGTIAIDDFEYELQRNQSNSQRDDVVDVM